MKKLVVVCLLLCAGFSLTLLTVVQASAALSNAPDAIAGLGDCELPCWREINPQRTTVADAGIVLASAGYTQQTDAQEYQFVTFDTEYPASGCAVGLSYDGLQVTNVALTACEGVTLGDFMAVLGTPESVLSTGTAFAFRQGAVVISVDDCTGTFSAHSDVQTVYLRANGNLASRQFPWHGFIDRDLYAQIEPSMPPCMM